jgi:hypothetical protein
MSFLGGCLSALKTPDSPSSPDQSLIYALRSKYQTGVTFAYWLDVALQRAFRQRKEGYIKKLEEQVRDYALLNENFKALQAENYQLRDYIINLQSRLIESQGEYPQPPIDGLHPGGPAHNPPIAAGHPASIAGLDPVRGTAVAGRGSDLGRHTPETSSHYPADSPSLKRIKANQADMTTAQQALQGRAERWITVYARWCSPFRNRVLNGVYCHIFQISYRFVWRRLSVYHICGITFATAFW